MTDDTGEANGDVVPRQRLSQRVRGASSLSMTAPGLPRTDRDPNATATLLSEVHERVEHVDGLLLATADGLLLAADTRGVVDDSVAAMAAAAAGLAAQFTAQAAVGPQRGAMFEGSGGYVAVFPVAAMLLLVVFGQPDISMGLFNVAAKQALNEVRKGLS